MKREKAEPQRLRRSIAFLREAEDRQRTQPSARCEWTLRGEIVEAPAAGQPSV
jgi:hypothetical protein